MIKELWLDGNYKICINTGSNKYELYEKVDGEFVPVGVYNKFENAKESIKRRDIVKKKKIQPINCLFKDYPTDDVKKARITSISKSNYGFSIYARITLEDKTKSKEDSSRLLKDTEKNIKIVEEIKQLQKKINELRGQEEKFTKEELLKHFEIEDDKEEN